MTRRYLTRPRAYWDDQLEAEIQTPPTMFIHESDSDPVDTGLTDRHGTPIYRVEERAPMGFKVKA